jgi:hypothetical protein
MSLAHTQAALTLVKPVTGMLPAANLKNLDNWRALLHQITPVVVTVLTALGVTTQDQAALWVALVFAFLDPLLSYSNTTDKFRQIVYGVSGVLQSGGLLTTILMPHAPTAVPVASALLTILSSTLSRFYTPTSTLKPLPPNNVTVTKPGTVTIPNNPWPV